MKKIDVIFVGVALIIAGSAGADLIWTGSSDGVSLYQEANFLDHNGLVPPANTINGNTAITADTGGLIRIDSGTGTPNNFGGHFDIGLGNDLVVGGGKVLAASGTSGIRVDGANAGVGPLQNMTLTGPGTTVRVQFVLEFAVSLDDGALLRLKGGGNAINETTINFTSVASTLQMDAETWTDFNNEHISKVSYHLSPLVFGSDPFAVEPGDNALASAFNGTAGVQINVLPDAIPEPGSMSLLAIAAAGVLLLRARRI